MMKKILAALFIIGINTLCYSQVKVKAYKNKKVKITFNNYTDTIVTVFNSKIFLGYDIKKKKSYIRRDRLLLQNDTLTIFLNDTSINERASRENTEDNYLKKEGKWVSRFIPPKDYAKLEIYFKPRFEFSTVRVFYTMNNHTGIAYWSKH